MDNRREFERMPKPGAPDLRALANFLGSGLPYMALALLLVVITFLVSVRIGEVSGTQVGIELNKLTGEIKVIQQSGKRIYNGITKEFYTIDRTLQTLEMTQVSGRGDRKGDDSLKIKTVDGSDVYVDLKVEFEIILNKAEDVITASGPGDAFKEKWARDYVRSIARDRLGELTTEEFYDSSMRTGKLTLALREVQERLEPFGINMNNILIPTRPRFYKEYEQKIKEKKLADQSVEEEKSKALAATQRQERDKAEETKKKTVTIEEFRGQMQQLIIQAQAEGERSRKAADAYFDKVTIGAEAEFYRMQKDAEAILAKKKAEAQGIEALKKALEGEGGRNMVKLEYARKLKGIRITGKPYTISDHTERFEHLTPAATEGRTSEK